MSPHMLHLRHQYCWECGSEATVCLLGIRERSDRVSTRNSGPRSIIIVIVAVVIIRVIQLGPTWGLPAPTPGQLEADCGLLSRPRVFFSFAQVWRKSSQDRPEIIPRCGKDPPNDLAQIVLGRPSQEHREHLRQILGRSCDGLGMISARSFGTM